MWGRAQVRWQLKRQSLLQKARFLRLKKMSQIWKIVFKTNESFGPILTAIHGKAPQGLERFPDPDAIFIGGTGGEMVDLIQICCHRLKEGGRIVLNAATIENLYRANEAFAQAGFQTSIMHAQISRRNPF